VHARVFWGDNVTKKIIRYILYPILTIGITVALVSVAHAAAYDVDPDDRWAWSSNAGWINFDPPNGGVVVYDDHLEGYAWGENVGWIRLGTHAGGGAHIYGNASADDYGVNRDASGSLSGYAWGTNVGWIDFDPPNGGVTIDAASGEFGGYAWGENVGWVHFSSPGPVAYRVRMLIYRIFLPATLRNSR
jgi:hypothetical protein